MLETGTGGYPAKRPFGTEAPAPFDEFDLDIRLGAAGHKKQHDICEGTEDGTTCAAECEGNGDGTEDCGTDNCGGESEIVCRTNGDCGPIKTQLTCKTCETLCKQNTCATCATKCNQNTCETCNTKCDQKTCANTCETCETKCNQHTCAKTCVTCAGETCVGCTRVACTHANTCAGLKCPD